jgi:glucose/arabinose dehydrogenase
MRSDTAAGADGSGKANQRMARFAAGGAFVLIMTIASAAFLRSSVLPVALKGFLATLLPSPDPSPGPALKDISLPPGFSIEVYAEDVDNARSLALGRDGTVFVGTRSAGKVYALPDRDGDRRADRVLTLARNLDQPNGVAYKDGDLYVAEIRRILRFRNIDRTMADGPKFDVLFEGFPPETHHGWKFIAFGPDGRLYVPIGAPCNICDRGDPYASITRLKPDGTGFEIFARGVRNTVGFDWHPATGELWFTDNGRDWLGDDLPPDELNKAAAAGLHFGFPYCHGAGLKDPDYGGRDCGSFTLPERELGPHVAALGLRFYSGSMFPRKYRRGLFIAEHGSWNRREPIGYRIMFVPVADGRAAGYEVFAQGWLLKGRSWGRPVDVLPLPDGSLLVSDDKAGAVYRIAYNPPAPSSFPAGRASRSAGIS